MKIDIVVPIYNAYDVLQDCLKSVEKYQSKTNRITLINDASTDDRVMPYINKMAERNNWQIINHANNLGFVQTANTGLKLSNNHTILLNSDTIVTKPWISAFKQAVNANPQIGTLTPWSNNAEICSFPKFLTNQKLPKKINKLAKTLYKNYQPKYPLIPTAVGFCMLISAKAKQVVGYFDEEHFGYGYGEENDYSLRVVQMGLQNILCDNAYVAHIGNQSFSDLGLQPNEDTMQRLLQKHPKYLQTIQKYIASDPLMNVRKKILSIVHEYGIKL